MDIQEKDLMRKRFINGGVRRALRMLAMFYNKDRIQGSMADAMKDFMLLATVRNLDFREIQKYAVEKYNLEQHGGNYERDGNS